MSARFILILSLATLTSCTVPDLGEPPRPIVAADLVASSSLRGAAVWPGVRWWSEYNDPQLDALIEAALVKAPDLASAAGRLRSAVAIAREAESALAPRVTAQGSAGVVKQSYNAGIPREFVPRGWNETGTVFLDGSFDLDIWGGNRSRRRAAMSEAKAAALELAQARLVLTTSVALAYADLVRLYAERSVALQTIKLRTETERLVSDRVANGLDTQAELKLATGAVPAARAELVAIDESIALARNQIAALIGEGPDRARTIVAPKSFSAAHDLPVNVTTDLLARRPDVSAALARVEAAAARVNVARSAFYPSIRIAGLVGLQALGLENVFKSGSTYGNAAPAISLPIFQGGAVQARYRGARAEYDTAVADYDATVVNAFRQVADAVTTRSSLVDRLKESEAALLASRQAFSVATLRYRGGLSTYLDVLTAQTSVLVNERTVAVLKARGFAIDVSLVRALGGGFESTLSNTPTNIASEDRTLG